MFAMGLRLQNAKSPMLIEVLTALRLPGGMYTHSLSDLNHNHDRNFNLAIPP
jgi:hypothetical protein